MKEIIGWTGKGILDDMFEWKNDGTGDLVASIYYAVFKKRGKKKDWDELSWPPQKIKITFEVIE